MITEKERVEKIAADSRYAQGANGWTTAYSFEIFKRFIKGKNLLEMGPAEGIMTDFLAQLPVELTICEGSAKFCEDLKKRHPKADVVNSLFENFQAKTKFDNIILGHVLEHVENPRDLLERAGSWLTKEGRVICAVPNSRSIHRQAAVMMGLLEFEEALNDADKHHGHRRVYNPETFRAEFLRAGFEIEFFGGYWLKPLSNRQTEEQWTPSMVRAFMQLGERYPDISAEIVIVARRKG